MIKHWKVLFKIQWIGFSIFIALAFIYYWDKEAHIYFNQSLGAVDFQSIFSFIMTGLFGLFTVITLIYPLLFLIQIYFIRHEKGSGRKLLFLFVLYLLTMVSVFSLYIINSSHAIKAIQS